jgi:hypothetical protein
MEILDALNRPICHPCDLACALRPNAVIQLLGGSDFCRCQINTQVENLLSGLFLFVDIEIEVAVQSPASEIAEKYPYTVVFFY